MSEGNPGNHENNGADVAATIRAALHSVRSNTDLSPGYAADLSESYRNCAKHFVRRSRESIESGDYHKAAKMTWAAFAASVDAIAASYRLRISRHLDTSRVCGVLAVNSDSNAKIVLHIGLSSARSLHQHIYADDLPAEQVAHSAGKAFEAIDLMQQRFAAGANGGPSSS